MDGERETITGLQFKGRPIQQGSSVRLDFGTVTLEPTIVGVGK